MSENVEKVIKKLQEKPELVKEINLVFTKVFDAAQVKLSVVEKIELFEKLKELIDDPGTQVHIHWSS